MAQHINTFLLFQRIWLFHLVLLHYLGIYLVLLHYWVFWNKICVFLWIKYKPRTHCFLGQKNKL